ncbi:MAG: hypothetical protein ACK47B_02330 [Armatimonadota bacterium]
MRGSRARSRRTVWAALALAVPLVGAALALPGDDFEEEPIRYSASTPTDPIAKLQAKIDRGEVSLRRDLRRGYLDPVLKALGIPVSSQTLVFAKTSFQRDRISPLRPRALYFNDHTYIGYVQGGDVLEISTTDPQLGAVFYVLDQTPAAKPKFVRQTHECLSCHSSSLTRSVPGHTVRSVYPARDGQPIFNAGTFITRDASPMEERWGGWYVTGTHGEMRHMGNQMVGNAEAAQNMDRSRGANIKDLRRFFDPSPYPTPHSDLVALMMLQHQADLHNLITRAGYETRKALHFEQLLNKELGRKQEGHSESTLSRIKSGCEPLVKGLLFTEEAPLKGPIVGTSGFTEEYSAKGPRDAKGRSLRQLDLRTRLLRYPCSPLIYSEAFDQLPPQARDYVYRRLWEVLDGRDQSEEFARLTDADRQAIREILLETKPGFAAARPATAEEDAS